MAKAVVYTLMAAAFVVLMVFFPSKQHLRDQRGKNRRLGHKFPATSFVTLVVEMERLAEIHEPRNPINLLDLKNDSFLGDLADAYEHFSEGKSNITLRLKILFPFLDKAPSDGVVSFKELGAWMAEQTLERLQYMTEKELASRDRDGDQAISLREYLPHFSNDDIEFDIQESEIEKNGLGHGEAGWWKEQLENADADQNGSLSFDEFKDFLHPEDSDNKRVQEWLLKKKIQHMDHDGDGKLNFIEFYEQAYDVFKNYVGFETAGADLPTAEEKFAELDVNKDRFLAVEELKPIFHYLHPGELSHAKYYTGYLIQQADDNKDGNLSLDEMLNNEYVFYSTVYNESNGDYDEDYHDEL